MFHRGEPPEYAAPTPDGKTNLTLAELRANYFRSQEKKLEQTTIDGMRLHFNHPTRILGAERLIPTLLRPRPPEVCRFAIGRMDRSQRLSQGTEGKAGLGQTETEFLQAPPGKARGTEQATPPPVCRQHQEGDRDAANRMELGTTPTRPSRGVPRNRPRLRQDRGEPAIHDLEEAERRVAAGDDPEEIWDCV